MPRQSNCTRSRSPQSSHVHAHISHGPRSRSPHRSHRRRRRSHTPPATAVPLPFDAFPISGRDLKGLRPMFVLYLDIQKSLFIEDLSEDEIKGRWKSFVGKWNRGELAEGWYDPDTLKKARLSSTSKPNPPAVGQNRKRSTPDLTGNDISSGEDTEDSEYGPAPPGQVPASLSHRKSKKSKATGPTIPKMEDLHVQREMAEEDDLEKRREDTQILWAQRQADRRSQIDRLDELIPKADAGTRERQLEKKRELATSNRDFASRREENDLEVREADVMGEEDSLSDVKRMKREHERKKNERELRREEISRARKAEREERMSVIRQKEDKTMSLLMEIAKARFPPEEGGQQ